MTDIVTIEGIDYPAEMAGDVREFAGFIRGFMVASDLLDAADDRVERLLADAFKALPTNLRDVLIYQGARRDVEEFIAAKVAAGELVRLTGGRVVEARLYDEEKHGPVDA